jgi:hypothetical protein
MTDSMAMLIDAEVMRQIGMNGWLKEADPYLQHLVKTSDHPLLVFRRNWIRNEALKQRLEAEASQNKRNSELAKEPHRRGANIRRSAVIEPYFAEDMRRRHKADLNDPDFLRYVKREEPAMFPKREAV